MSTGDWPALNGTWTTYGGWYPSDNWYCYSLEPNKYSNPITYSIEYGFLPEKEDKMEVWEYVIVLLDEDDEKVEVKESGFVVSKDRDRAISKAASEYAIADNEMVIVRKFFA